MTTFTKDQGDDIVKKFYGGLLPLMGISRSFPKVYRFASGKFYGLELPHPYIEQGILALEMLLTYGNSECISNKLFQLEFEQFQLEVGSGTIIF